MRPHSTITISYCQHCGKPFECDTARAHLRKYCAPVCMWRRYRERKKAGTIAAVTLIPKDGFKKCSRCGLVKPLAGFWADHRRKSGKRSHCIECSKGQIARSVDYQRQWRAEHRGYLAQWRVTHPGYFRKYAPNVSAWKRRNPEKIRAIKANRRARKHGAFIEKVDPQTVFVRDGWRCGICGNQVLARDATVDHIVPLAKGGEHSYANVQTAHMRCNSRKGTRVLDKSTPAC